jgi:hypothetical protein
MSDNEDFYSEEDEPRDNYDSDPEYDDYASEPDVEASEIENNYTELLNDKYQNLMDYNNRLIDTLTYTINNIELSKKLHELQFKSRNVERSIINKETELRLLLEKIESGMQENMENYELEDKRPDFVKPPNRNLMNESQLREIVRIKQELNSLLDSHTLIEESNEPINSSLWMEEWNTLSEQDRVKLERIAERPFPKPQDYSSHEKLQKAQDDFLDDIKFALGYFEPFIKKEETELIGLATRHGIKAPRKNTPEYDKFIIEMRKLLRKGYIYRAGVRKIGGVYEKIRFKSSPREFAAFLKQMRDELPYRLEPDEQEFSDQLKREELFRQKLKPFLAKLNKEELYSCITNSKTTKTSTFQPRRFPVAEPKKVFIPRVNSRQRIVNLFKSTPDIVSKINELENYVYKITSNSAEWYNKKIRDIIFILNNYPDFKQKFKDGQINVFQLALFQNLLLQNGILKVYPVKYETRQKTIRRLIQALYQDAIKINIFRLSEILTKVVLTRRSRLLENFVFELATTKQDYLSKIYILIKFIEKNGTLARTMPVSDLLTIFNPEKQPDKSIDYTSYSREELAALLSTRQITINQLTQKIKQLESLNYTSVYVIFWPMPQQVKPDDPLRLLFEQKIKKITPPMSIYSMNNIITELNGLRVQILNKYNIRYNQESSKLSKQLKENTDEKVKILKIYNSKILDEYKKVNATPFEPSAPITPGNVYQYINSEKITELLNAIKRKLIKQNFPGVDISLLELYDMNELFNNSTSKHVKQKQQEDVRYIDPIVHKKIKDYLVSEIDKQGITFLTQNNKYLELAIQQVISKTGVQIELTTYRKAIEDLVAGWKPNWQGEQILDNYGENVFQRLLLVNSGLGFYKRNAMQYYELEQKYTPKQQVINRRPKAQFDGKWYNVEYLDKDWSTGEPLLKTETVPELSSTGRMELVERKIILPGKIPYIKRILQTNRQGQYLDVWQEVEPGQIRYLEF